VIGQFLAACDLRLYCRTGRRTSAHSVRTKCRNSAARPIDGVDFNAKLSAH